MSRDQLVAYVRLCCEEGYGVKQIIGRAADFGCLPMLITDATTKNLGEAAGVLLEFVIE